MVRHLAIFGAILGAVAAAVAALTALGARGSVPQGRSTDGEAASIARSRDGESDPLDAERERRAREHAAMLDRDWPLHGLVTGTQLTIRAEPSSESTILGWVRLGGHLRLARGPVPAPGCRSGWYRLYPRGHVCAGQGVEVSETPPPPESLALGPDRASPLPYRYLFVKEPQVPEWYQLPSRDDQRAAEAHALRYVQFLREGDQRMAQRLREGRLPNEPPAPREVARFLEHGFFLASNGVEIRSRRRFVRTVRGTYVKEAQLEERSGSSFSGVELGREATLPVAWAIRPTRYLRREVRGDTTRVIEDPDLEPIDRLTRLDWIRRERVGGQIYHVVRAPSGEERLVRDWHATVAELREPPRGVAPDEPWVHVDLSSQTLVMYRGAEPIYATLVSTGTEGHETPVGEFTIRRKMVTDTMADPGSDLGDDRYRIEDVPWTQYFDGSIALHAAFWHAQFGITRSHGCVNIPPRDAHWIFQRTWPEVPEGWHGVSTEVGTRTRGSRVVVTP